MSYIIVDVDGTLTTSGDTPNESVIKYLNDEVMSGEAQLIVVSARNVDRLEETRAWLQENGVAGVEHVYLNDFEGTPFATGIAFKEYKYGKLVEQYGADGIKYVVDNDADARAAAQKLGLEAKAPSDLADDESEEDSSESVDTPDTGNTDPVVSGADKLNAAEESERFNVKDIETRSVVLEEFRLAESDGQKVFVGYAATYGHPSDGLPFTEVISRGAFKRTLARVAKSERVVKFLHGHDESRMLASTASGRLSLVEDEKGLRVEAKLDPADPDAAAVISKLTHEAKAMGMSFGFTVPKGGESWDGETRTLNEINLFEVSILSGHQPAYPSTLGLSAVRKLAETRIGVDAERLLNTLETVKAGKSLTDDEVEVIDAVRSALAPKPATIDQSIAAAKLLLAEMENESL